MTRLPSGTDGSPAAVVVGPSARGAWRRLGISRNGGQLLEEAEAVWLQVGNVYADSRGFAGTTSFDGSQVRFHHEVGEPGDDVGSLCWDGENLVETGSNLDGSTFLEIWTPLPGSEGETGSWRAEGCQVVRVGRHVVHVDGRSGTYLLTTAPGSDPETRDPDVVRDQIGPPP
ncbi:hypothetical protein [Streptacidiphilus rugosus]|uniref:hypothetical protein n=1 Tax=Streptacidiphilus rugosus TaxID=405783 RepID=UPI00068B8C86|nr:hypothetical protein [Streptacidiphilus rugosus]